MPNIRLKVVYDGTRYLGWQKTAMGPSIEEALEVALTKFLGEEVALNATSRTDAGVHARCQIVQFHTNKEELSRLYKSLNSMLPRDIAVWEINTVDTFSKPTSKEYRYSICNGPVQLPPHRHYSWHIRQPLNLEAMRQAAKKIVGKRDFSAFCNVKKNEPYESHVRTVFGIEINSIEENRLAIKITGDSFLYKMVRNIVGTLCYVGMGKIDLQAVDSILESQDRTLAGMTAPAHGLCLEKVFLE